MVAACLAAVVGLAIYSNLDSGLKVMKRVTRPLLDEDISIVFEKFSRDLQNSFQYAGILFQGGGDKVAFATTVRAAPKLGGDHGIGRITYFYDSNDHALSRRQQDLNQIYKEKEGEAVPFLRHIAKLKFTYYTYARAYKEYQWKEEWDETETKKLPLAVKVELEFDDTGQQRTITRTIAVPTGG